MKIFSNSIKENEQYDFKKWTRVEIASRYRKGRHSGKYKSKHLKDGLVYPLNGQSLKS